jgi:twitching motility protein PilT
MLVSTPSERGSGAFSIDPNAKRPNPRLEAVESKVLDRTPSVLLFRGAGAVSARKGSSNTGISPQAGGWKADGKGMFDVDTALLKVIELEASDLHLKVPSQPIVRRYGKLVPIEGAEPLKPADTEATLFHMLTDETKLEAFRNEREVDFSYSVPGVARFRVNAFVQRGSVSLVCRAIPFQIKTVDELLLPAVISEIADEERGLILLTGTTGSGKSTTLASMIDHINSNYAKHIVTIEDPVEFLHRDKTSIINQREVGEDTASFARALRRVLRQDPDVILVGEMRDEETVRTALSAAETGHLVLSTIHTVDAAESVNRIIDFFPQAEQRQARSMLAGTLKAVISQRLVPTPDRLGRVATCEILRMTGRVKDMITNPEETGKLPEVISEGAYYGMQTFDQALLYHVQQGRVSMEDALKAATHPHDFKLLVSSDGMRSSSAESVFAADDAEEQPDAANASEAPAANGAQPSVTGAPGA